MELQTLQEITKNFTQELTLSKNGDKTSIAYIKNEIPSSPLVQNEEIFQVMVIGGTNYISSKIKKTREGLQLLAIDEDKQLPKFETGEEFLQFVKTHLHSDVTILALNFAFPLDPVFNNGKLEGILLRATKEHSFEGLLGENLCAEIEKYVKETLDRKISVSVANDTICLLLSGTTQVTELNLAAGIVGTGINLSFFENATTLINTECGSFNKFPVSSVVKTIDETSLIKGLQIYEKAISGGYLYMHFNLLAPEKGLSKTISSTAELDSLTHEESPEGLLAREIFKESAQLVSCGIAGVMNFKQSDITFVMQGSVFWKGYNYKETVEETVKQLCPNYSATFIKVEHADILGAAKLVA